MGAVGVEVMLLEPVFGWWWLIALVAVLAILCGIGSGKRPRRNRRRLDPPSAKGGEFPFSTITGKAYVTDGGGMRVAGQEVRPAGLDSPEHDRNADHRDGHRFRHGKRVKGALIREIGGRQVQVSVESVDRSGRLVGTVTCKGRDIGEWLVREGHAIAAHDDRYRHVQQAAREAGRGMWAHSRNFDPGVHRHRKLPS